MAERTTRSGERLGPWNEARVVVRRLCRAKAHRFPPVGGPLVGAPQRPGIYVIRNPWGIPVHVGATGRAVGGIRARLRDHLGNGENVNSTFTYTYLRANGGRLRDGFSYATTVVEDPDVRARSEVLATARFKPLHLGNGFGGTGRGRGRVRERRLRPS